MTYMYHRPQYHKIHLPEQLQREFPNYHFYRYCEGYLCNETIVEQSIPIIFITGNADSHKQVRSLASVAKSKLENSNKRFRFIFFSVDLNEEFSAFSGSTIINQAEFVAACIRYVFYGKVHRFLKEKKFIIIGNSMGGIVGRLLLHSNIHLSTSIVNSYRPLNDGHISIILTQATPNYHPVIQSDRIMREIYQVITSENNHKQIFKKFHNINFLSIYGGERDYMIDSFTAKLSDERIGLNFLSTNANAIPNCWLSADHKSIVWCNQLVITTIRCFIDLVNEKNDLLYDDSRIKQSIINFHFFNSNGDNSYKKSNFQKMYNKKNENIHRNQLYLMLKLDKPSNLTKLILRQSNYYFLPTNQLLIENNNESYDSHLSRISRLFYQSTNFVDKNHFYEINFTINFPWEAYEINSKNLIIIDQYDYLWNSYFFKRTNYHQLNDPVFDSREINHNRLSPIILSRSEFHITYRIRVLQIDSDDDTLSIRFYWIRIISMFWKYYFAQHFRYHMLLSLFICWYNEKRICRKKIIFLIFILLFIQYHQRLDLVNLNKIYWTIPTHVIHFTIHLLLSLLAMMCTMQLINLFYRITIGGLRLMNRERSICGRQIWTRTKIEYLVKPIKNIVKHNKIDRVLVTTLTECRIHEVEDISDNEFKQLN
ncbi:hypothetical protein SNEBB_005176 [Seison nebaliae]|nr:hypothetical protein SNEBB_005176 [Seison nebaliae]